MSGRVVHLVVPGSLDQRTGGYLYDARMVSGLRALGWRVGVVELQGDFPRAGDEGVEGFARRLDELPASEPVVVDGLAGGAHPDVLTRAASNRPVVALVHHPLGDETGLDDEERRRLLRLEVEGLRSVTGVVVSSPFTARRLASLGVPRERIRVVIPGTEVRGDEIPAPSEASAEVGPLLLSVGSVTPRKGHDLLVEALAGLSGRPWRCVVVGSLERAPEFAAGVREQAAAAGLGERIAFTGEVDGEALTDWWARAHLFVLPSWYEGYGMALTEALIRGLPVVSTTGGAIPDTVPAAAGVLVSPGDVGALREALERLLTDDDRRAELAAGARAHAAALPDWQTQASAFGAALTELCAHG